MYVLTPNHEINIYCFFWGGELFYIFSFLKMNFFLNREFFIKKIYLYISRICYYDIRVIRGKKK